MSDDEKESPPAGKALAGGVESYAPGSLANMAEMLGVRAGIPPAEPWHSRALSAIASPMRVRVRSGRKER